MIQSYVLLALLTAVLVVSPASAQQLPGAGITTSDAQRLLMQQNLNLLRSIQQAQNTTPWDGISPRKPSGSASSTSGAATSADG